MEFLFYLFIQSLPPYGGEKQQTGAPITHPAQERLATPPESTSPTLFEQWCGFFYVP